MTYFDDLVAEPWRYDFYSVMRRIERSLERRNGSAARIGESGTRAEETLAIGDRTLAFSLGQDAFMAFPASTLSKVAVEGESRTRFRVLARFLGMLGPQGALPLNTTEEAFYFGERDQAFVRFLDLFNNRFQQLFFRAWADARPAAQHDRPSHDRFMAYVGSMVGLGSAPFLDQDSIPDLGKLAFAGLLAPQAKSASRLRSAIRGLFAVRTEIEEFVGSWLELEVADRTQTGRRNARLGRDTIIGQSVFTVQDKFKIVLFVADMTQYAEFLPGGGPRPAGRHCEPLVDLVFFYIGDELDWEIELAVPARKVTPVQLGQSGMLGWTSWMTAKPDESAEGWRHDARFRPAERMKHERAARRARAAGQSPRREPVQSF